MSSRAFTTHLGGNTRYTRELSTGLEQLGHEVHQFGPARRSRFVRPGVRYLASEAFVGRSRMGTDGIDLLHFTTDTGPVARALIPIVTTIHGVASKHIRAVRSPTVESIWRGRVGLAARASAHIVTVSRSSKIDVHETFGVPLNNITVIHHGIDHVRFSPRRTTSDISNLELLGLPETFVLYLGNIDPRKNVDSLVRAFQLPEVRALGIPLVVAGRHAWGATDVDRLISESSNVLRLPEVPEPAVAPLMRRATAFVFPSLYEGFGFPVLEAMACGTPVVCSDRGSLREVAGGAGLKIDPTNIEDIAHAVVSAVSDRVLQAELVSAGIENAGRFRWESTVKEHEAVYKEVLENV